MLLVGRGRSPQDRRRANSRLADEAASPEPAQLFGGFRRRALDPAWRSTTTRDDHRRPFWCWSIGVILMAGVSDEVENTPFVVDSWDQSCETCDGNALADVAGAEARPPSRNGSYWRSFAVPGSAQKDPIPSAHWLGLATMLADDATA